MAWPGIYYIVIYYIVNLVDGIIIMIAQAVSRTGSVADVRHDPDPGRPGRASRPPVHDLKPRPFKFRRCRRGRCSKTVRAHWLHARVTGMGRTRGRGPIRLS